MVRLGATFTAEGVVSQELSALANDEGSVAENVLYKITAAIRF
jgi:hypothetical protein